MSFCTQCGTQLLEGRACECTEVKQFCTECGVKISDGSCTCAARPVSEPEYDYENTVADEVTVRQYNIAELRNRIRATCAIGHIQVTNKRVIFKAEGRKYSRRVAVHREFALSEIVGVNGVNGYRFSVPHLMTGLMTVAVAAVLIMIMSFMGGWAITNLFVSRPPVFEFVRYSFEQFMESRVADVSQLGLIFGLIAGFGGMALYFVLRRKFWLKQILLGVSLGGFVVVGLTGNAFAYALLGMSVLANIYGLAGFAILPDLIVCFYGKGGACIDIVRARSGLAGVFKGTGYAEAAPTNETEAAINELGTVIADMQSLKDA